MANRYNEHRQVTHVVTTKIFDMILTEGFIMQVTKSDLKRAKALTSAQYANALKCGIQSVIQDAVCLKAINSFLDTPIKYVSAYSSDLPDLSSWNSPGKESVCVIFETYTNKIVRVDY